MQKTATALALLLVAGCVTPPRVTTEQERALARTTLNLAETAIAAARISGKIDQDDYDRAISQLGDLRQLVEDSAAVPLDWSDVVHRVSNFALAWVPPAR